ncbi:MAG: RNA 2',3'-cyclic phosphodiesterase [Candidatus Accumulibacter sp.]|nr:RNA 2',3'-cyclic phosphodiesterase [Accumulibacter sp.]
MPIDTVATPQSDLPAQARLFLALWPAAGEHAQLLQYQQQWSWPRGASPVRPERLHLTLHFIGPLERRRITAVSSGLRVPFMPFTLQLSHAEVWPRGLVVLRASALPAALAQLHAELARALQALALPVEARAFRPHVTLARRAAGATLPATATPPAAWPLCWPVDGYVLVESLPGAGGGYRILRRYA